jgi:hypothetical protein
MQDAKKQHQEELEALFSKNQLMPRMRAEFENFKDADLRAYGRHHGLPEKFTIDLLVQMALHKRCDLPTLVGTLRHHCKSAQECADWILKAVDIDLVDYMERGTVKQFIVKAEIADDVQAELDRFQYPLPMVVPPKHLTRNDQSGYLLNNNSVILRNNHHEDDVCLDHINRMNKIKFSVNLDTATMIKNKWRGLDRAKEDDEPGDFEKRKRAFEKYDRTAREVITTLIKHDNEFHFTHRYCKRGRTYCQGHHANYQGTPWNKAVIEFKNEELTV